MGLGKSPNLRRTHTPSGTTLELTGRGQAAHKIMEQFNDESHAIPRAGSMSCEAYLATTTSAPFLTFWQILPA